MKQPITLFVGSDVHKDSISVAYAAADCPEPPHFVGPIGTRQGRPNCRKPTAKRQPGP